jgi:tRNA/rRNA methyltransferase
MKVMGFADLVLVAPRFPDVLVHEDAVAMASGAADILVRARVVPTLAEALEDVSYACASAMTPRDFGPPTHAPREHLPMLAASRERVGFVFGSERHGMSNEDIYRCHAVLCIPTDPSYGSLNLAQAAQVVAYEWRQALGGFAVKPRAPDPRLATVAQVQGMLEHLERSLVHIGFLDPEAPKKLMPRLNQLFNRARLSDEEVHILRGIAKAMDKHAE